VTRHGPVHIWAAAIMLPPMAHRVPNLVTCNLMISFDHHSSRRNRCAAHQHRNKTTRQTCNGDGRTVPRIDQKSKPDRPVPVEIQYFRTPPAPETLQESRQSSPQPGGRKIGHYRFNRRYDLAAMIPRLTIPTKSHTAPAYEFMALREEGRMAIMNASRCGIAMIVLAGLGVVPTMPAAAMESCIGQYSAAALSALPTPMIVWLDLSGSTITSPNLAQAFTRGLQEAGQQMQGPPNAILTLSWSITGQGGAANDGGGTFTAANAAGQGNWPGSNAPWLQGGETAAMPGIPSYTMFSPKPAVQSALLFLRAQLRPTGASVAAWIATVQCTIQPVDNAQLAYRLGNLIGGAMGKEVNSSPM
jgi:hypothetical protein